MIHTLDLTLFYALMQGFDKLMIFWMGMSVYCLSNSCILEYVRQRLPKLDIFLYVVYWISQFALFVVFTALFVTTPMSVSK
jgi:hypothetical protein